MEWVEVTGKTVEEAVDSALDELGVDESDAEVEVLEEPKVGLFGLLRSEARVRARVAPTAARPKAERRGRRERRHAGTPAGNPTPSSNPAPGALRRASTSNDAPPPASAPSVPTAVEAVEDADPASAAVAAEASGGTERPSSGPRADEEARDFLEGLLEVFDLRAEVVTRDIDADTVEVAVVGDDLGLLIGPRGQTLAALQDLTRGAVQRACPDDRRRVMIDVGGYRKARREALERFTRSAAAEVLSTGVPKVLEPMPPPDRKVVHDTVNTIEGVSTVSEGEEPQRRVVILRNDS